jgi:hypothetical protein
MIGVSEPWPGRWVLVLALLYAAAAAAGIVLPFLDGDVWWHLRTAEWIVEHKTVPWFDPFSIRGQGQPWVAYSWLFELLLLGLFRTFGLIGIVLYGVLGAVGVTLALQILLSRYRLGVPRTLVLTAIGVAVMAPLFQPRSFLLSIVLFIVELHVLLHVRETGRTRPLVFLPLLFVLWANLHIQFVYGLFVLGVAAVEPLVQRALPEAWTDSRPRVEARFVWLTFLACVAAIFVTPYHVGIYRPLLDHITQVGTFDLIMELQAPNFRFPTDWMMLALTLGAVFVLGRQRTLAVFPTLVLAAGVMVSFRAARDAWFVTVVALAIIAGAQRSDGTARYRLSATRIAMAVVLTTLVVAAVVLTKEISPRGLEAGVRKKFPVAAAAVIEERRYGGPIYNDYKWGGYLIWRLPTLPVSMDGRANVYGPETIRRSALTWSGVRGWESDPDLARAGVVIAAPHFALAQLLRGDRRFDLAYEDDVATVFVARR